MPNDITRIYVPFGEVLKDVRKSSDGTDKPVRILKGLMTDESLDLDQQIVDFDWGTKQAEKWHGRWGNIREQHSSNAIGKSVELGVLTNQRAIDLTGRVIDPLAIDKIDEQILQGWSIGIKGARTVKDAKAPNGRIVGGEIVEVSLVDHPANENCKVVLVKAAKGGKLENVTQKVAGAEQTKLAETDLEKADGAQSHGHLHPHNAGTDQEYEHDHGHEHGPVPLHDDGVEGDHAHDHVGTMDSGKTAAVEADSNKATPVLDGEQKQHNKPVAAAIAAIQTLIQQEATESVVDFTDISQLTQIGSDLQNWVSSEAYESQMAVYMAAIPEVEKLIAAGDHKAAIGAFKSASAIVEKLTAAKAVKTKEAPVEPKPEDTKPPATEPSAAETTDKTADADTMKAAISEAMIKAVETAIAPLREKVDEMAKRAAPGGPMLNGSKLLSAPEDVRAAAVKARVGDITLEDLRDVAENHPDGTMRMGAKQLIAEIQKVT